MARLTGTTGAVYVWNGTSFVKVLDIYDWEFHAETTLYNCSIKSDTIERFAASHGSGIHFTAKRRNEGTNVWFAYVTDAANNGTQTQWRLDLVDNNNSFTQITCYGFAKSANLTSPLQQAVDDTFELQIDQFWSWNL